MNAPRISSPREPGLFARTPALERYRLGAGGLTLLALEAGDRLQVIDLEGWQPCELLVIDAQGRSALADWSLSPASQTTFIPNNWRRPVCRPGVSCRR